MHFVLLLKTNTHLCGHVHPYNFILSQNIEWDMWLHEGFKVDTIC